MKLHIENNVLLGFERGCVWPNGEPEYMHLVVPETVCAIADGAFSGCREILSVSIPGSVKTIGKEAFFACGNLRDIVLEDGVESIGDGAFELGFYGDSPVLPTSLQSIGARAFNDTRMTAVRLPENLKSIGAQAFKSCVNLESVSIPGTVTVVSKGGVYLLLVSGGSRVGGRHSVHRSGCFRGMPKPDGNQTSAKHLVS